MYCTSDAQNLTLEKIEMNYIATDIYWQSLFQNLQQNVSSRKAGGTSVSCKYMKVWVQFNFQQNSLFSAWITNKIQRDGCKEIDNINLGRYSHIQLHSICSCNHFWYFLITYWSKPATGDLNGARASLREAIETTKQLLGTRAQGYKATGLVVDSYFVHRCCSNNKVDPLLLKFRCKLNMSSKRPTHYMHMIWICA